MGDYIGINWNLMSLYRQSPERLMIHGFEETALFTLVEESSWRGISIVYALNVYKNSIRGIQSSKNDVEIDKLAEPWLKEFYELENEYTAVEIYSTKKEEYDNKRKEIVKRMVKKHG